MERGMHLLGLTLEPPGAVTACVQGCFTGTPGVPELVLCRGQRVLELYQVRGQRLRLVTRTDVFGVVRSLCAFRLPGARREHVVVGSDSGRVAVLETCAARGHAFVRAQLETFGKSGCRRVVPGEYVAADPRGRAVMVAAAEKQKLVYVLNRDARNRLTISSPLEAHKSRVVVFGVCGVDVGYENPQFAALECDYTDVHTSNSSSSSGNGGSGGGASLRKVLTYYELDLGLNSVTRKYSDAVDPAATLVATVPGWKDGPGGVLVCAARAVYWMSHGHAPVRIPLPQRYHTAATTGIAGGRKRDEDAPMITAVALHQQGGVFFFLLQNEDGDVFKLTLEHADGVVQRADVLYFDTLPVAASLAILRSGHLFLAAEFGDNQLYQFRALGSRTDTVYHSGPEGTETLFFEPRGLVNLAPVDALASLAPVTDALVLQRGHADAAALCVLCGRGAASSLRVLRHGLAVGVVAETALPQAPRAVWTVRGAARDAGDRYIVLAYAAATMVLAVGAQIEESTTSGLVLDAPTLAVGLVGADTLVQVHTRGVRVVRADGRVAEWQPPACAAVTHAALNAQQALVALAGGAVVYFEHDPVLGALHETARRAVAPPGTTIAALDIAPASTLTGTRARFAAVALAPLTDATSAEATTTAPGRVLLLSLAPESCLQEVAVQVVLAAPTAVALTESAETATATVGGGSTGEGVQTVRVTPALCLHVGLASGVLCRAAVDGLSGELADTHSHVLGTRPVTLCKVTVHDDGNSSSSSSSSSGSGSGNNGVEALAALSSRAWLCYRARARFVATPLCGPALAAVAPFASEQCPAGFVGVHGRTLRVFTLGRLGDALSQTRHALPRTPRRLVHCAAPDTLAVLERDGTGPAAVSGLRVLDPATGTTLCAVDYAPGEAAVSLTAGTLTATHSSGGGSSSSSGSQLDCVVVGTALADGTHGRLYVYAHTRARTLELVHATDVAPDRLSGARAVPRALHAFAGRLLAGVGACVRVYELGRRQLLRKGELQPPAIGPGSASSGRGSSGLVCAIHSVGSRVAVGDARESYTVYQYTAADGAFVPLADDSAPRWLAAGAMLDHDTVACGDKFGTLAVLRVPAALAADVRAELQATGSTAAATAPPRLAGAPHRLEVAAATYVGDTATRVLRASLGAGAPECLLYTTVLGAVGALVPLATRADAAFFQQLELHLRAAHPPLCGRDHLAYRSSFGPVRDVVDGDLCEQYADLPAAQQAAIASDLDRSPAEVLEKLEEVRRTHLL